MLVLSSFIVLFLGVTGEDECDYGNPYEKCSHLIPRDKLKDIHIVPDKDELMAICPGQLRYFQCFTDYIDECGPMGEHFTRMEFMENSYEIAKNLCNPFSQLHRENAIVMELEQGVILSGCTLKTQPVYPAIPKKSAILNKGTDSLMLHISKDRVSLQNYVASVSCYNTLDGVGEACEEEAKEIYATYFNFLEKEHPSRAKAVHTSSQKMCMVESYKAACLSEKVLKECGELAQSTMMEVFSGSQYLRQFCSLSMVDELKTTFLNFADLEEDELKIYKNAFYGMTK